MMKAHFNFFYFCLIFFFFFIIPLYGEDLAYLQAEKVSYNEDNRLVIASENVRLKFKDVEIKAPYLKFDIDQNVVWGTGNITLIRGESSIKSQSFFLDLENTTVIIKQINLVIKPKEVTTGNIYLKVAELEDKGEEKCGENATLTTCDYENPHYYVKADRFNYYPDSGIWAENVYIYSPIFFPIGGHLWLPYYHFALGKRNPILLVPQIGENNVEGYFVKTTWDYLLTKDQTGEVYLDWTYKKGVGLGFKHNYDFNHFMTGSFLLYAMKERDTAIQNYRFKVDPTFQINPALKIKPLFEEAKGYLINGGRTDFTTEEFITEYNDLGDRYFLRLNETRNRIQSTRVNNFQFEKTYNSNKDLLVNFSQTQYGMASKVVAGVLQQEINLPNKIVFSDKFQYNANKYITDKEIEQQLQLSGTLVKTFDKEDLFSDYLNNLKLDLNYFLDLDGDAVTRDMNVSYVEKMPEISLGFRRVNLFGNIALDNQLQFGKYLENYYLSSAEGVYSKTAQKLQFDTTLSTMIKHLELSEVSSNIGIRFNFSQRAYDTGDKLFAFVQNYSYHMQLFSFIRDTISYNNESSLGNTPFYFDEKRYGLSQAINNLTFYWERLDKYNWQNKLGWDFLKTKAVNYTTEINIKPTDNLHLKIQTGYHFENRITQNDIWDDLSVMFVLIPLIYKNQDLNFSNIRTTLVQDLDKAELVRFEQGFKFFYGKTWESRWDFDATWSYNFNTKGIRLQTLAVIKDLHCQTIALEYNAPLEEYRFKYTIKAFPEEAATIKTNKYESFKFEGLINDKSQDRFKDSGF